jgi:hypothetical protein
MGPSTTLKFGLKKIQPSPFQTITFQYSSRMRSKNKRGDLLPRAFAWET